MSEPVLGLDAAIETVRHIEDYTDNKFRLV